MPERDLKTFSTKVAIATAIVSAAVVILGVMGYAAQVMLVIFAGILFAIFLRGLAGWVSKIPGLSSGISLVVVLGLLLLMVAAFGWLVAGSVAEQIDEIATQIPSSQKAVRERLSQYEWARQLMQNMPDLKSMTPDSSKLWGRISGVFSGALGAVANLVVVLFLGLYMAASPRSYTDPLTRLFPQDRRPGVRDTLRALREKLWYWLLGRLLAMALISVLTYAGLWLLGVPSALVLALLAGLLNFIPNIGPILALIPAALLSVSSGMTQVLWVVLLYSGIQLVESYVLTPLVQQRNVNLAPALTISVQLLMGVLLGVLGLALATPLTVVVIVLVNQLYLGDGGGDRA